MQYLFHSYKTSEILNNLIPKYYLCTQTTCNSMTFNLKNKGRNIVYLHISHHTDGTFLMFCFLKLLLLFKKQKCI